MMGSVSQAQLVDELSELMNEILILSHSLASQASSQMVQPYPWTPHSCKLRVIDRMLSNWNGGGLAGGIRQNFESCLVQSLHCKKLSHSALLPRPIT